MEQSFILKYHGKFSLFEQANIVAEDRQWWIKRLNKQKEAESKESSGNTGGRSMPNSKPSMPSVPRR